ncbi:restriction endonuclease [Streptoalloteichus tenebrarius]|nr:restriction endonuclease [Streptoalloteichus tenebrarius]
MNIGDLVVMPLKSSPHVAIGRVTGNYTYLADEEGRDRRHVRPVQWLTVDVPRTVVKQDLLHSLGAFSTVCEISRNDAAWRLQRLAEDGTDPGARTAVSNTGKAPRPVPGDGDDEVLDSSQLDIDIERYAMDRITSRTIEVFAGHRLTDLVAAILEAEGMRCEVSPPGPDHGVDIVAGTGVLGLGAPRLVVQVKSEATAVGLPVVQQLLGAMTAQGADQGLLVAWGGITRQARQHLASQRFAIRIWEAGDVLDRLFRHYRGLPADIQADLPLKQVWTLVEEAG